MAGLAGLTNCPGIKALGISEGKMIGAILNALLAQVLNNPELNEYEKLEELALKIYQEVQ